jgi:hypothetical protein
MLATSAKALLIPDTGSVRNDLAALARAVAVFLSEPTGTALARTPALTDDAVLAAARREFWASRFELATAIIRRGVERGEVPEDTDPVLVLEALIAPLHMRTLITRTPLEDDLPERLANLI